MANEEMTVPGKALRAQMIMDHYTDLSDEPTTSEYQVAALILRDLLHWMVINDHTRPDLATKTMNAGATMHMIELVAEKAQEKLPEMIEHFKKLKADMEKPAVPAGFEKFMPGVRQ